MNMAPLTFPELHYPFPPRINKHVDAAEQSTVDWLVARGLLTAPEDMERFRRSRMAEVVARQFPDTEIWRLELLSKWYVALFTFDDQVCDEALMGKDPGALVRILPAFLRSLEEPLSATPPDNRFGRSLAEIWQELARCTTPGQYMRFADAVRAYFLGIVWEAAHRQADTVPSVPDYIMLRSFSCATLTITALLDWIGGYVVPGDDLAHPDVRKLQMLTAHVNAWCNDICSLGRETAAQTRALHSLPIVIAHEKGCSLDQGLAESAEAHNAALRTYVELEASVRTWASPALSRYLDDLRNAVRGFYDWGITTVRYSVAGYFVMPDAPTAHGPRGEEEPRIHAHPS